MKSDLESGIWPNPKLARPWEFLNHIHFPYSQQQETGLFRVSMGLDKTPDPFNPLLENYTLGVHLTAPALCRQGRPPMVLTLVIDVSMSMSEKSGFTGSQKIQKLELMRIGLRRMLQELVPGDIVNLVAFSKEAYPLLENLKMPEDQERLRAEIEKLAVIFDTNLNAGLQEGYRLARKYFQPERSNRLLLLTDAYANEGRVDPQWVARQTRINDRRGIYFSGLGYGLDFNQDYLNQLTEEGQGAYYSIVNPEDAERAFGERFMALTHTAARNVRFKLDYPAWMQHGDSAAEELSKFAAAIRPTHFSFNTSQFFLEKFRANPHPERLQDRIRLEITYTLPADNRRYREVYSRTLAEIIGVNQESIHAAEWVTLFTDLLSGRYTAEQVQAALKSANLE
ncbi:hypothetical protein COW64_08740 [bacterium (Candidatus Blackallbacteria) CG18_big_fil_WC_8_21_14_2_50_49_26]|nr:MAG: hypothetical protein COW64_08740 [bacterium (Candidatus Blackallbacteria) CG18_big_fil_WC_8_21_14_2_50_49_26]